MCRVLLVSRSGFYRWLTRGKSARQLRRETMTEHVVDTFTTYQSIYGAPRIAKELNELGISCSLNYVADLLKTQGLRAHNGKSFNYGGHALTMNNVADNLLKRKFDVGQPNRKWVSDITYIWIEEQWLYLATVMDLFSRKIVGWSLDDSMSVELVISALKMALNSREVTPGLILHSDRGTQYRSNEYMDFMRANGCEPSMSRKGNCWDTETIITDTACNNLTRAGIDSVSLC